MARLRLAFDDVVIAAAIGIVFIALAYAEGLRVPGSQPSEPIVVAEPNSLAAAPVAAAR
jgi:hypothetical protein